MQPAVSMQMFALWMLLITNADARQQPAPRMAAPSIKLASLRPLLPPIDPSETPQLRIQSCTAPLAPIWASDDSERDQLDVLIFLDNDRHITWTPNGNTISDLPAPTQGAYNQAVFSSRMLITCGANGMSAVDAFTGNTMPLPFAGAEAIQQPTALLPLSDGKMLVASGADGEVSLLGEDGAPLTVLASSGGLVTSMCATEGEREFLLTVDGAVRIAPLQADLHQTALNELAPSTIGAVSVATDRQANLYVATEAGIDVIDSEGERILLISLPEAATGCCFGGPGKL